MIICNEVMQLLSLFHVDKNQIIAGVMMDELLSYRPTVVTFWLIFQPIMSLTDVIL